MRQARSRHCLRWTSQLLSQSRGTVQALILQQQKRALLCARHAAGTVYDGRRSYIVYVPALSTMDVAVFPYAFIVEATFSARDVPHRVVGGLRPPCPPRSNRLPTRVRQT